MSDLGEDIFHDGHLYKMPENDDRSFPDEAASAPFDVDGYHWKTGNPKKSGYYQLALSHDYCNSFIGLPVEIAYYSKRWGWSRTECEEDSLLTEQYWLDEDEDSGWVYSYYPAYWCELTESGELLPCRFDW